MSKCTITLEDDENGMVTQEVSYGDAFDVGSGAHHLAVVATDAINQAVRNNQTIETPLPKLILVN